MSNLVVLTGGGTGGHIYPSIEFGKYIQKHHNVRIIYIGLNGGLEEEIVKKEKSFEFFGIDAIGIPSIKNIKRTVEALKQFSHAKKPIKELFKKEEPLYVFGTGGYVSAPALSVAKKMKIPFFIHEQNMSLGKVNKHFHKSAKNLFLTFELNEKVKSNNVSLTGNPRESSIILRKTNELKIGKKKYDFKSFKKPILVILSGSRGAKYFNEKIISKYEELNKKYIVFHILGSQNEIDTKQYSKLKNINILDYCDNIIELLKHAKIVICRSGATTLAELRALNKVSILVPSPNVKNLHQHENAKYFVNRDMGYMMEESEIDNHLLEKIDIILKDKVKYKEYENNLKKNSKTKASGVISLGIERFIHYEK